MDEALKNPHRRKILEILSTKKASTPRELSEELGISITTVYYHLEIMRGLVAKTARGEFSLTEKGLDIYRESLKNEIPARIMPYSIFSGLAARSGRLLPVSLAVGALELYVCISQFFRPSLLTYSRSIETVSILASYPVNILIIFAILEAAGYALTRRTGGELSLFNGIMISRVPLMATLIPPILEISSPPVSIAALALGQLASIYLLSISISLSKGIRQEISIMICLLVLYFSILVQGLPPIL